MGGFALAGLRGQTLSTWHSYVGLAGAALLALSAVLTVPAVEGELVGLVGLAGFLIWLAWLLVGGVRLATGGLVPAALRRGGDGARQA